MVPALSLFVICAVCVGAVSLSPIGCGVAASTARYHSHSKRHINIRASGASDAGSEIAPMLQHSRRLRAFTRLWRLRGGNATTAPPNSSSSTGQTAALANTGSKATGDGETARQPSVVAKDISSSISNITASERASLLLRARVQAAAYLMQIRTQEAIAGRMAGNVTNLVPYVQRLSQLFLDTAFPPPGNIDAENTAMSQLRLVQPFRPLEISNSTIEALSIDDRAALELDMKSTLISIIAPTFYKSLSALQTGIYSNFDAGVRDMVASGHYSAASAQALISALLEAFDASTGNIRNAVWGIVMNVSIPSPSPSTSVASRRSSLIDAIRFLWKWRLGGALLTSKVINTYLTPAQMDALSIELDDALRTRLSRHRLSTALSSRFDDLHAQMVANGICNPYVKESRLPPTSLTFNWVFRPDNLASSIMDAVSSKNDADSTGISGLTNSRGIRPILPQTLKAPSRT